MPDIDKLQELSAVLDVSIDELLTGERITDTSSFIETADADLAVRPPKNSSFVLQDRIAYFKRKWIQDHKVSIALWAFAWGILCFVAFFLKQPIIMALLPIAGFIIYGHKRNQMMIYVEDRAFITNKELSDQKEM